MDAVLRARVNEFYTEQLNHHFRQAEAIVAQESKDYYYESKKPDLKSFEIVKIEYSPGFKNAVVSIRRKVEVLMMGALVPMQFVDRTNWKIEKGKWCWYIDKSTLLDTPFGPRRQVPTSGVDMPPSGAGAFGSFPTPSAAALRGGVVQLDHNQVRLDAFNPQPAVINLRNILPGPVTVTVVSPPAGVTISVVKPSLGPEESTQVVVTPVEDSTEYPAEFFLNAQPLNQTIRITITWAQQDKPAR